MRLWRVTFTKITGHQIEPSMEVASFEVDAATKPDAVRTALDTMRVATVRDSWDTIEVRPLADAGSNPS